MATATISLPDDQLARLRLYAAMKGRRLDEVIGEAVEAYLASLPDLPTPRVIEPSNDIPDDEWQARFDALMKRRRSIARGKGWTEEQVLRDVNATVRQLRSERTARHR